MRSEHLEKRMLPIFQHHFAEQLEPHCEGCCGGGVKIDTLTDTINDRKDIVVIAYLEL